MTVTVATRRPLSPDNNRATLCLPPDILVKVASHLSQADLFACATASRAFLDVFGPEHWKRISFDKLKEKGLARHFTDLSKTSSLQCQIRSYVQAVDIRQRVNPQDDLLRAVGSVFSNIRLVTIREYSDRPATDLAHALCGQLPPDRPIKIVFYRVDTTAPAACQDGSASARQCCRQNSIHPLPAGVTEAVIHFTAPRDAPSPKEWVCDPHASIFASAANLKSLTLVFDPNTPGNLRHIYSPLHRHYADRVDGGYTISSHFYLDPNIPDASSRGQLDRRRLGHNFVYALAVACLSTPTDCQILLANFDQAPIPFNASRQAGSSTKVFCRSKCGCIITYDAGNARARRPPPGAIESYEAQLAARMARLTGLLERWIERLLQDEYEDWKIMAERKWRNIRFATLARYMRDGTRKDEWERAPGIEFWM